MKASYERSKEKQKLKPKSTYTIPKFSAKGKRQAVEVAATKKKVKTEALEGGFICCDGCERYFDTIDASHKVPLSQSTDLASTASNLRLFCRRCHNKWEHGTVPEMIELNCFEEDMHFLLDMDPERFWKIFYRLLDEYNHCPVDKPYVEKLGRIIGNLEKFH